MARKALVLVFAAAALVAAAVASGRESKIVGFRTPSKNIACQFFRAEFGHKAVLRCDIFSGLKPEPRRKCELDWVGVEMTRLGKAHPLCAGDTVYDKRLPILRYGHRWKHKGITCRSKKVGLKCRNLGGHGFFLSRQRWRVY